MPVRPVSAELVNYFIEKTDARIEEIETLIEKRFDNHESHMDKSLSEIRALLSTITREQEDQKMFKAKVLGASLALSTVVSIAGWAIALMFGVH